jgi:hypothetical protein
VTLPAGFDRSMTLRNCATALRTSASKALVIARFAVAS